MKGVSLPVGPARGFWRQGGPREGFLAAAGLREGLLAARGAPRGASGELGPRERHLAGLRG